MRKSKLVRAMTGLLLALTVLAGCSSGGGGNAETGGSSAGEGGSEKVTIKYWRHDNDVEVDTLKQLIASFQKEHPNITVKMEIIPYADYETKIRTALAGKGAPDVMGIDGPNVAAYAYQDAVIPLDDYFAKDGDLDDIAKPVRDSLTYNDQIWAAPLNDASVAMFYNKKMFESKGVELPSKDPNEAWTWEQVLDAARKINDPGKGVYAIDPAWGVGAGEGSAFVKMPFIWQAGGEILSPDGGTADGYLNSPESKRAIEFFNSLYTEKLAAKELPPEAFETGKLGINVSGPWSIGGYAASHPNFKLGEDWDIAPLWKDAKQVTPNGSWNLAITKQSKHPDEAWLFLNWVTGKEGAKVWYEKTKNLPARLSVADAYPELKEYPMNIFVEQSSSFAHPRPVSPAYPTISKAITDLFEEVVLGGKNIDDSLGKAVETIDKAIEKTK
ncbi:ABC transporter substrate-binding protein [Paenibacillus arenilitoris]|uniref:Sugar ABC transporter substrate-binding protein n=1 Tax=Paenibacillus arenilitoris TaxID=2772299 RepID=A0A927CN25_9BACL|nr:sugar ABC transporter substrate-binding protein [Paenibacillus arenilitoris]MBD2870579.1 sugar ABC transporter substrate-binding protein [Paenibacillus arenilitoris]